MTGIRFELISVELCDFASSALWNDVSARIFECRQKSPAAFVHNPVCMCTAAHPLQIHTPLQTCTFYVSECICFLSPGPHCIKVCCSSATLSFCYHCSYRGSLSKKKPHFLAVSANRHHLLCCCSISSPCYLLLPKPQLTKPSRADVRVLRCACQ